MYIYICIYKYIYIYIMSTQRDHVAYSSWLSWEQKKLSVASFRYHLNCELFPRVAATALY